MIVLSLTRRTLTAWTGAASALPMLGLAPAPGDAAPWEQPLTFSDEFDTLSVSGRGDDTRWSAHTPWHGDFGDAKFVDPGPGFPFSVNNGALTITAQKDAAGQWRSGLLSSTNPDGRGFSQLYGYFEARAKVPAGPGVWPAFWLVGVNRSGARVEIDIMEYYGRAPRQFSSSMHVWPHDKGDRASHDIARTDTGETPLSDGFHTFGAEVTPQWTSIYFDRRPVQRFKTPLEHTAPLGILVNLALGSGWPIDKTPNPSLFLVDYVRVYAPRPTPSPGQPGR